MKYALPLSSILLAAFVAGCSLPEPYVFRKDEFDRSRVDFAQELPDMTEVRVCYNRRNASPDTVRNLAEEACGHYGKTAVFTGHETLECPILVPAAAHFDCVPKSRFY